MHNQRISSEPVKPCPNVNNPRKPCTCTTETRNGTRRDEAKYWLNHILGRNCD